MRVGWLGLGAMGAPMAACLARSGHSVHAYDIVPGRAAALAPDGVQSAETVTAAVANADVVAIMVATPGQVEQVLFAEDGAAGALPADSIVMIMATVGPDVVVSAASRLAGASVTVVDAPVSGGTKRAAAGDLLIMVSGPAHAIARVQPLLGVLARSAPVVGPDPGDGQRMKLVDQAAVRRAHRGCRRGARIRRVTRPGSGTVLAGAARGRRSIVHVRRPRGANGHRPVRPSTKHDRHLRQGYGPGHRGGEPVRGLGTARRTHARALRARPRTGHGPPRRFRAYRGFPHRTPGPS